MSLEQIEQALLSMKFYPGVVGCFGGNPAMRKDFAEVCALWRKHVPFDHSGIWSNNPITLDNAREMRKTFHPGYSNLNVHLDHKAFGLFRQGWPECRPVGLTDDSRHSPVFGSMIDLGVPEEERWERISRCDINQHWSAIICTFRGELRAFFCEVAGAQALLHQDDPSYPDTGKRVVPQAADPAYNGIPWWKEPIEIFSEQVRQHCHNCLVPLRGYGQLACDTDPLTPELTTSNYRDLLHPKNRRRPLVVVSERSMLEEGRISKMTRYLQNASI